MKIERRCAFDIVHFCVISQREKTPRRTWLDQQIPSQSRRTRVNAVQPARVSTPAPNSLATDHSTEEQAQTTWPYRARQARPWKYKQQACHTHSYWYVPVPTTTYLVPSENIDPQPLIQQCSSTVIRIQRSSID